MRPLAALLALLLFATAATAQIAGEVPVSTFELGPAADSQGSPAVASDGTNYLTVWLDTRSGSTDLYASRVDFRGVVLDPLGIRVGSCSGIPDVIWTGRSYAIFWSEGSAGQSSVHVARVGSDGTVLEAPRTLIANAYGYRHMAASNGSRVVVAYNAAATTEESHVAVSVYDGDMRPITLDTPLVKAGRNPFGAAVATNGSGFLVVWVAPSEIISELYGQPLDASGTPLAGGQLVQGLAPSEGPLVASDGQDYLVLMREQRSSDLLSMRVSATMTTITQPHIVAHNELFSQPRLVFNNDAYLLVWTDYIAHAFVAMHLDRTGTATSPTFTLTSWPTTAWASGVELASNGGSVLLVWNDNHFTPRTVPSDFDVMAKLVDARILIANPDRLVTQSAPRQFAPSIVTGGGTTLAVWSESRGIYAARMTADGSLDGRGISLSADVATAQVAFDGSGFTIVWFTWRGLFAAHVDVDGHATAPVQLAEACASSVAVAGGANRSLVVWTDCSDGSMRAVRVDAAGRPLDTMSVALTPATMRTARPRVTWNGSEFFVAFEELIEVPSVLQFSTFRSNVRAVRVSNELTLLDTAPLAVAVTDDRTNTQPAVASDGSGFLVTWSASDGNVAARHYTAAGAAVEAAPIILGAGAGPEVAWDGARYAIIWREPAFGVNVNRGTLFGGHVGRPGEPFVSDRFTIGTTNLSAPGLSIAQQSPGNAVIAFTRLGTEPQYANVERAFVRPLQVAPPRARAVRK